MSKEEIVAIMVETFCEVNKNMALMSGMAEEEADKFIEQSKPSIEHTLTSVYDVLVEKQAIK
jgi:hypothetical protein